MARDEREAPEAKTVGSNPRRRQGGNDRYAGRPLVEARPVLNKVPPEMAFKSSAGSAHAADAASTAPDQGSSAGKGVRPEGSASGRDVGKPGLRVYVVELPSRSGYT